MERRNFLKALVAVPFLPAVLKGMEWAAPTVSEAATAGKAAYSCAVPAGTILPYLGPEAPPGFLPCDGRAVPRVLYPKLYEALGDAYGTPSRQWRAHRFRVPDMQVRARPPAAVRADRHAIEHGRPPVYAQAGFQYVIKS